MKIIFDGKVVRYEGDKGQQRGKYKASLPNKRVPWTAVVQVKDGAGNATEAKWSTQAGQRMNYQEAKAAMFAVVEELQRVFRAEYNLCPDSAHFVMVSR